MVGVLAAIGGIGGLVVGSFLNVVAYRVPLSMSVVRPPSHCPKCDAPVRPRDNVPIVSWLLLRGKCRDCSAPISFRYPLVELTTALLFAAAPAVIGARWVLGSYWWFIAVGVALTLTDLDHKRIPNRILYPGVVVGGALLTAGALLDGEISSMPRALAGALLYFAMLLTLALVARGGLGFGDVKLAVLLGMFTAFVGWDVLGVAIVLAIGIGGAIAIGLLVAGSRGRKDVIPFGPSLIAGAFLALWVGEAIADWYLRV